MSLVTHTLGYTRAKHGTSTAATSALAGRFVRRIEQEVHITPRHAGAMLTCTALECRDWIDWFRQEQIL